MRERDRFNEFKLVIFFQKNQLEIVPFSYLVSYKFLNYYILLLYIVQQLYRENYCSINCEENAKVIDLI